MGCGATKRPEDNPMRTVEVIREAPRVLTRTKTTIGRFLHKIDDETVIPSRSMEKNAPVVERDPTVSLNLEPISDPYLDSLFLKVDFNLYVIECAYNSIALGLYDLKSLTFTKRRELDKAVVCSIILFQVENDSASVRFKKEFPFFDLPGNSPLSLKVREIVGNLSKVQNIMDEIQLKGKLLQDHMTEIKPTLSINQTRTLFNVKVLQKAIAVAKNLPALISEVNDLFYKGVQEYLSDQGFFTEIVNKIQKNGLKTPEVISEHYWDEIFSYLD